MTNPDGKCYVFDSRGAGYARGEGVVSFILKNLDDAIKDGDKVHALIRNSGLNQDGKTAGLTLPNPASQASLMRQVYRNAHLNPADTAYVEAHGTGTKAGKCGTLLSLSPQPSQAPLGRTYSNTVALVGDSAEISSIADVFCGPGGSAREGDLYVGSIKSNIGHLEASSGVAGLLKAILILKHGMIPPNIDFVEPKPTLHLEERHVKVCTSHVRRINFLDDADHCADCDGDGSSSLDWWSPACLCQLFRLRRDQRPRHLGGSFYLRRQDRGRSPSLYDHADDPEWDE